MKNLWFVSVGHEEVPGLVALLFYQTAEPSDRAIKRRAAAEGVKPSELIIDRVFDLSWHCRANPDNLKAIEAFDDANTRAAMKGKKP